MQSSKLRKCNPLYAFSLSLSFYAFFPLYFQVSNKPASFYQVNKSRLTNRPFSASNEVTLFSRCHDAKYPHRNSSSRESRGSRLISSCPLHLTYISYSRPSELRLHFITPTLSLFLMKHSLRDCRDALAFPFFIAA